MLADMVGAQVAALRKRAGMTREDLSRATSEGLGCDRAWLAWGGQLAPATGQRRGIPEIPVKSAQTRRGLALITDRVRVPQIQGTIWTPRMAFGPLLLVLALAS